MANKKKSNLETAMKNVLSEFLDSYIIIGVSPKNELFIHEQIKDEVGKIAVEVILEQIYLAKNLEDLPPLNNED